MMKINAKRDSFSVDRFLPMNRSEPIYYFNKFQSQFLLHHYFFISFFHENKLITNETSRRCWISRRKVIVIDSSIIDDCPDCFNLITFYDDDTGQIRIYFQLLVTQRLKKCSPCEHPTDDIYSIFYLRRQA